jgi:hypothetical protein
MRLLKGESASVDLKVVEQGQKDFKAIISDFKPEDVFNLDEFALFWKLLPDRFVFLLFFSCRFS